MNDEHRRLQQPVRLARQLVALRLFLADRQQADARRLDAERDAGVDAAHHRELQEMLRPALDARADVEQHGGAVAWWESSPPAPADRRPASMPNAACAAITVAPVWPALKSAGGVAARHRLGGDLDRRARLAPQRRRRRFVHRHHVRRVDRPDAAADRRPGATPSSASSRATGPTSDNAEIDVPRRGQGAIHDVPRGVIAAHRVNGDPDHRRVRE